MSQSNNLKTHKLKTIHPYFNDVWTKKKLFEVRKNDRDFNIGDAIILIEYDNKTKVNLRRRIFTKIIYILDDRDFCKKGFVILQLGRIQREVMF